MFMTVDRTGVGVKAIVVFLFVAAALLTFTMAALAQPYGAGTLSPGRGLPGSPYGPGTYPGIPPPDTGYIPKPPGQTCQCITYPCHCGYDYHPWYLYDNPYNRWFGDRVSIYQ